MKVSAKQTWALATVALHFIPIAVLWMQWQQMRLEYAALPGERVMEVKLQPSSLAEAPPDEESSDERNIYEPQRLGQGESHPPHAALTDSSETAAVMEQLPLPPIYLTASELDARPHPDKPLTIPFPNAELGRPVATGVLVLYIGLDGKVDSIEVVDSTLPPEFERAAKEAFMHAKMQPGMRDGKAVRSQMKVLVEFESRTVF